MPGELHHFLVGYKQIRITFAVPSWDLFGSPLAGMIDCLFRYFHDPINSNKKKTPETAIVSTKLPGRRDSWYNSKDELFAVIPCSVIPCGVVFM